MLTGFVVNVFQAPTVLIVVFSSSLLIPFCPVPRALCFELLALCPEPLFMPD